MAAACRARIQEGSCIGIGQRCLIVAEEQGRGREVTGWLVVGLQRQARTLMTPPEARCGRALRSGRRPWRSVHVPRAVRGPAQVACQRAQY